MNIIRKILLAGFLVLSACSANEHWKDLPKPAPMARFTLLEGGYVPLESYRGKVVMLAFWGAWCSASKSLVRGLNELSHETDPARVAYLAVSIDKIEEKERYLGVIQSTPLDKLEHAFSGNEGYDEAFNAFSCTDVPHLFIIDELGNVVDHSRSSSNARDYLIERGLLKD